MGHFTSESLVEGSSKILSSYQNTKYIQFSKKNEDIEPDQFALLH